MSVVLLFFLLSLFGTLHHAFHNSPVISHLSSVSAHHLLFSKHATDPDSTQTLFMLVTDHSWTLSLSFNPCVGQQKTSAVVYLMKPCKSLPSYFEYFQS